MLFRDPDGTPIKCVQPAEASEVTSRCAVLK
jgi:hypothetical protein